MPARGSGSRDIAGHRFIFSRATLWWAFFRAELRDGHHNPRSATTARIPGMGAVDLKVTLNVTV
jgi:hypothetical protein